MHSRNEFGFRRHYLKEKTYSEERISHYFIIDEWIGRRLAVIVDTGGDQSTGLLLPEGPDKWKIAALLSVLDWFYKDRKFSREEFQEIFGRFGEDIVPLTNVRNSLRLHRTAAGAKL